VAAAAQSSWRLEQRAVHAPVSALVHDTFYSEGEWVQARKPCGKPSAARKYQTAVLCAGDCSGFSENRAEGVCCLQWLATSLLLKISYVSRQPEYTPPVIYSRDQRAKLVFL